MSSATPKGDDSPHLHVSPWMKIFMYSVCLLPIALMIWALWRHSQLQQGSVLVHAVIFIAITLTFGWLFTRLYSLCSIDISSNGVEQTFVLLRGDLGKRVCLRWDQVKYVSFSRHSYHFIAEEGLKMELNTTLFGDAKATIRAVRMILPERLLSRLDSGDH